MSENTFKVINPATGKIIKTITRHSEDRIKEIIIKRNESCLTWRKTNAHQRSKLLRNWSVLIQENKESIAKVMTEENGKPIAEWRGEVDYATSDIDGESEEANGNYGRA